MKTKKIFQVMMFLMILCGFTVSGWAEDDAVNFGSNEVTEDAVLEVFDPPPPPKSRSIRPVEKKTKAISMEINFGLNSYTLTSKARKTLDVIGSAINNNRLQEAHFIIEGHTDASGSESLNRTLSQKRARAVRNYLVNQANVSPDRLKTIGKGERELLIKQNPYSAKNRRVKFIMTEN